MKCPECITEGKTSKVYPEGGFVTAAYCQPFYDEEGVYHNHDSNECTSNYSCSNGHRWVQASYGSCKCGWTGGNTVIRVLPPGQPDVLVAQDMVPVVGKNGVGCYIPRSIVETGGFPPK